MEKAKVQPRHNISYIMQFAFWLSTMSVSSVTRHSLRSSPSFNRYVSSKPTPPVLSLTPAKLRALISIYHQSAYFITPQNLSSAIDRAFIGDPDEIITGITAPEKEMNILDLKKAMRRRESQMLTGRWKRVGSQSEPEYLPRGWSEGRRGREKEILGALYGTTEASKPGLEVLKEEAERLLQNMKNDRD